MILPILLAASAPIQEDRSPGWAVTTTSLRYCQMRKEIEPNNSITILNNGNSLWSNVFLIKSQNGSDRFQYERIDKESYPWKISVIYSWPNAAILDPFEVSSLRISLPYQVWFEYDFDKLSKILGSGPINLLALEAIG